jgi:hypothetical protein
MAGAMWTVLVETTGADGGATARIEIAAMERDMSSPASDDLGVRLLLGLRRRFPDKSMRSMLLVN